MECVKRKKDEFERDMSPMSPSDLLRYPRFTFCLLSLYEFYNSIYPNVYVSIYVNTT